MRVRSTALLLFVFALLPGCSSDKGLTRIDWQAGQQPSLNKAAEPGDYALYTGTSNNALVVQRLKQGDPIGFETNDIGRVRAIAGPYSTTLDPLMIQHARWQLMEKPEAQPMKKPE
jgi:hypothetical protein